MRRGFDAAVAATAVALFLVNEHWLKGSGHPFLTGYFNDVLAGMLLLAVANLTAPTRTLQRLAASLGGAAVMLLIASFACEVVLPRLTRSHGDPLDALAYCAGGAAYLLLARMLRR
jgi:hypothetical protein